ncbi:hypothetical protein ABH920_008456 [Catenulispora sp. EB89]|uniref:hypothetical protein n=1 Tax=Catenulispora sp. EB89 TaxID=3156257 RepID=UPI003511C5EF
MKPLVKTVATTAVVLAGLAGCASRSSGGSSTSAAGAGSGGSSSSSSSSSAGQTPSTPPSSTGQTGTPNPSNPSDPGTVKYVALQGLSLQKDGVTLVTEVNWGGCYDQPTLVIKSQDASKVVIEEKTVSHYRVGMMCPDFSRNGEATVKLDAPLGSRQVIDGVKNVAISVS